MPSEPSEQARLTSGVAVSLPRILTAEMYHVAATWFAVCRQLRLTSHLLTRLMQSHCGKALLLSWKASCRTRSASGAGRQLQLTSVIWRQPRCLGGGGDDLTLAVCRGVITCRTRRTACLVVHLGPGQRHGEEHTRLCSLDAMLCRAVSRSVVVVGLSSCLQHSTRSTHVAHHPL